MNRGYAAAETAASLTNGGQARLLEVGSAVARTRRSYGRHGLLKIAATFAVVALAAELTHPTLYAAPTLRATLESVMTLFALAAALLLGVCFFYSRRLSDLLLLGAVLTLGFTYFCAYSLPTAANFGFANWLADTALWSGAFVAAAFSAAAFIPADRTVQSIRRPIAAAAAASATAAVLGVVGALVLWGTLGGPAHHSPSGAASALRHPAAIVLAIAAAAMFIQAALSLARTQRQDGGRLALLPAALVLLASAQLSYLVLPWMAPDDTAFSDLLRMCAIVLVLGACARDAARAQQASARAASIAERRRVASDLHDGLAQDLAFIAAYSGQIADQLGAEHPVVVAARRALVVSRGKIAELTGPPGASAKEALDAVADELGTRFGIDVAVRVQLDREPGPQVREHVSRITREAIANAARHGHACTVLVTLSRNGGMTMLRVCDDGCGISAAARVTSGSGGFGLASMRDRATALGGTLSVRQSGDSGTVLEVVLP